MRDTITARFSLLKRPLFDIVSATIMELGEFYNRIGGIWDKRALSSAVLRELRRRGATTNRYGDWVDA